MSNYIIEWLAQPLVRLQLFGLAISVLYMVIGFYCYKLYQRLEDKHKVWAVAIWIMVMGIGSCIAVSLPGYYEGQ